ncbi:MAG TPA: acyl-CoA dehydrogenase family protein [Desulfobacterales bacterium]
MDFDNFLMNAFWGRVDPGPFESFQDLQHDEKTRAILREFDALTAEYPPDQLEKEGRIPEAAMERLRTIGFFGLNIPQEYGGVGLNLWQYLKLVEAITARNMALGFASLAHLSIGTKGILLFGSQDQKHRYLPRAASGQMIFSYALTEPEIGSDAKNITTTAELSSDGRHYILNGRKTYITNANYAGGLTVFAQLDPDRSGHMGAFVVETGWEGVRIGRDMPKMGLTVSSTAAVQFKNVVVPQENLLGAAGDGFKIAMTILNYGRLALGAGSSGMMKQSLKDMRQRAESRIQFGVPIQQFELVQEKLVRAEVNRRVTSAMTAFTAGLLADEPLAQVAAESSHCKLFGTTRAWETLYDAMQVAGGAGYLSTLPYERRLRDFRVATIFEGTTEIHSVYPAIFLMRSLAKRIPTPGSGKWTRLRFLLRGMFGPLRWRLRFGMRPMDRAVGFARANARRIRLLVHAGLLLYGKDVGQREFFLRRITHLSLQTLAVFSLLARIEAGRRRGSPVDADLRALAYFIEATRRHRDGRLGILAVRLERLHRKVWQGLQACPPSR